MTAPALLRLAQEKRFALIDEIGGFELLHPDFYEALTAFLFSGKPCVGVLEALPGAEGADEAGKLPPEYIGRGPASCASCWKTTPTRSCLRRRAGTIPTPRAPAPLGRGIRDIGRDPRPRS